MLLDVNSLSCGYGKLTVVHGVSLDVAPNEIVLLLGPNGAGKSTLLRTIAGHLPVREGSVTLGGTDLTAAGAYERAEAGIGYVPQERNVFRPLTVMENLAAATLFHPELADAVEPIIERFPRLGERRSQLASTLSSGERQMLAVGAAMVGRHRLLLLDEPTAGLAPRFVGELVAWIGEVAATGTGVLWVVEQNPEAVIEVASRAYFMAAGEIRAERPASSLADGEVLRQVLFDG